jgi:ubiquinone/menaquinone biosynthesis C-methylase UbiE
MKTGKVTIPKQISESWLWDSTDFAGIKQGDHVLDLGSGTGNDCFVARALVGENGKVTGLDITEPMIKKARENCNKLNFKNVEFFLGDIENMPFEDNMFVIVISNCVLNLVRDKQKRSGKFPCTKTWRSFLCLRCSYQRNFIGKNDKRC